MSIIRGCLTIHSIHWQHVCSTTSNMAILSFELQEQSREAAFRFMKHLKSCSCATTLGDIYSEVEALPDVVAPGINGG